MAIADSVKNIKAKCNGFTAKEKQNHRVVNIMLTALFALIFLLTLFGGVNVNIGSVTSGDGKDEIVRQSFFQLVRAGIGSVMSPESAEEYYHSVNKKLKEYGVEPFVLVGEGQGSEKIPYEHLDEFNILIKELRTKGVSDSEINKINWVLYRYAYSSAMLNTMILDPDVTDLGDLEASWGGSRAVTLEGQAVLIMFFDILILVFCLVMMIYSINALIKKKPFTKAKTAFVMLSLIMFLTYIFSFGLMKNDWTRAVVSVLLFVVIAAYCIINHIMMDERDFSLSMFIHNAVLLLGSILVFVLLLMPLFNVSDVDSDSIVSYGYSFIYDLSAAQRAYLAVPMSYLLTIILFMALVGLPVILSALFVISCMSRFITADYQANEKRIHLSIMLAVTLIIFLVLGLSNIMVTDLFMDVSLSVPILIIVPVVLAGLIVFEVLFKTKPVKKELVVR